MLQEKVPLFTTAALPLQLTEDTPESESETVPVTAMVAVEETVPSEGAVIATAGGVLSMLRLTLAVAELPDASTTVPLMT